MKLSQVLYTQGFGARRECEGLIASGFVSIAGVVCDDPSEAFDPDGLQFSVRGESWPYREKALIVLNKPAGHECSQKPKHHPSIYSLLPAPLRRRDVQAVGRLDEDTTGLLLLTDDGGLIHRWTSPKHHVPKVYDIGCKHPVSAEQVQQLLHGVTLIDDPVPVRAATAEATGPFGGPQPSVAGGAGDIGVAVAVGLHGLRMTLTEGKYHQVKRMVAAVGNRVEALHRSRYGALTLPADLAPGQWRWLDGPHAITPTAPPLTAPPQ